MSDKKALTKEDRDFVTKVAQQYTEDFARHGITLDDLLPDALALAAQAKQTYDESIGGPKGFDRYCGYYLKRLSRICLELIGGAERAPVPFYDQAYEGRRRIRFPDDGGTRLIYDHHWSAMCVEVPEMMPEPDARAAHERVGRGEMPPNARVTVIGRRRNPRQLKQWSRYQDWVHSLRAIDPGTRAAAADALRTSLDSKERDLLAWMLRKLDGDRTTLTHACQVGRYRQGLRQQDREAAGKET